jgi:HEAT repeat protein
MTMSRAVPDLACRLNDSDPVVRINAAKALAKKANAGVLTAKFPLPLTALAGALIAAIVWLPGNVPLILGMTAAFAVCCGAFMMCLMERQNDSGLVDAVPALCRSLDDSEWAVQCYAARAIACIGPDAKQAVPTLIITLKQAAVLGDYVLQDYVIDALGRIGPEAKSAVPELIDSLRDYDWRVQCRAAQSLGRIGTEANEAIPALKSALHESTTWTARAQARKALRRIEA